MKNSVTVSAEFYFKGEKIAPELELDLDRYMAKSGCLPDMYPLLARAGSLDLYSYEYEMLQAENLMYSQATGLVADFIEDGVLDLIAFEAAWTEKQTLEKLAVIAKDVMGVDSLSSDENLQKALLQAYQLGKGELRI